VDLAHDAIQITKSVDRATHKVKSTKTGFSADATRRIAGISYRQLDYWDKTALVQPSVQHARGKGSRPGVCVRRSRRAPGGVTFAWGGDLLPSVRKRCVTFASTSRTSFVPSPVSPSCPRARTCSFARLTEITWSTRMPGARSSSVSQCPPCQRCPDLVAQKVQRGAGRGSCRISPACSSGGALVRATRSGRRSRLGEPRSAASPSRCGAIRRNVVARCLRCTVRSRGPKGCLQTFECAEFALRC
jgi:hypothetical protein